MRLLFDSASACVCVCGLTRFIFERKQDGQVSANEIRSVMAGVYGEPLTETEIEEVIKMSDVDGDGQINYNEFVTLVLNKVA